MTTFRYKKSSDFSEERKILFSLPWGMGFTFSNPSLGGGVRGEGRNKTLSHFSNTQINFRVEKLLSPRREKCIHYSPLGDGFTLFYPSLGGGVRGEGRNKTLSRICKFTLFVNKFLSPKWRCCKLTQKKTALKSGLEFVLQFLVCRRLVCVLGCV